MVYSESVVLCTHEGLTFCSVSVVTLPHVASQICHEFTRFSEFMPGVRVANFFGGIDIKKNREELKKNTPTIVVGTPGRIKQVPPCC